MIIMKRHWFLILFIGWCHQIFGQYEVGTQWTYSLSDFGIIKPQFVEITGDTLIGGETWGVLSGIEGCASDFSNCVIRKEASKVYYKDLSSGEEFMLYDFSLGEGDSYTIAVTGSTFEYTVNIDSVRLVDFSGVLLNVQYIDNPDVGSYIIEGIGSESFLFPQGNICDPHYSSIRCFNSGGYFLDFNPDQECDETYIEGSSKEYEVADHIKILPNPAMDFISIEMESPEKIEYLRIIDGRGNIVKQYGKLDQVDIKIDINDLNTGLYILEINCINGVYVNRFVKK